MTIGIYCIENNINKKKYIGQSVDIEKRHLCHINQLRNNKHHSGHLQSAWNKYGESSFKFITIEVCDEKELTDKERYWINNYNTTIGEHGYNIREASSRGRFRAESKIKMSLSRTGDKNHRYGKTGKLNHMFGKIGELSYMFGKHHTEETKKKISIARKGCKVNRDALYKWYDRSHTEETKEKIRVSNSGKHHSEETKEKIRNSQIGIPKSKEHTEKNRISHTGIKQTLETKRKHSVASTGENNGRATITETEVMTIVERLLLGDIGKDIAKDMGISTYIVSRIKLKKSWKHLTSNIDFNTNKYIA